MIFILVLAALRHRATTQQEERTQAFWRRENEANNTRKVDLSTVETYSFDLSTVPAWGEDDPEIAEALAKLREAAALPMMNLNGLTNTDLKLQYGPQNLDQLTVYGDNYSELETSLLAYGKLLYQKGHTEEGKKVLERGISLPTDLIENYELLAAWYRADGTPEKIAGLRSMAEQNLAPYSKAAVLRRLGEEG